MRISILSSARRAVLHGVSLRSDFSDETLLTCFLLRCKTNSRERQRTQRPSTRWHAERLLRAAFERYGDTLRSVSTSPRTVARHNAFTHDAMALADSALRLIDLEAGDMVVLSAKEVHVMDRDEHPVGREIHMQRASGNDAKLGLYRHYMQREIFEQATRER